VAKLRQVTRTLRAVTNEKGHRASDALHWLLPSGSYSASINNYGKDERRCEILMLSQLVSNGV
jgi:hypothetical protein